MENNYDSLQENRPPVLETDAEVKAWEVEQERNLDHARD